jgi:hypothetical protein
MANISTSPLRSTRPGFGVSAWPSRPELLLLAALAALLIAAGVLPAIPQDESYHHFADARAWLSVPYTLDVLSNLGFLAAGVYGLLKMKRGRLSFFGEALQASAFVMFLGYVLTAVGSTWYHLAPSDSGLVADRLGMVVAFAGVLGMAASQRVSERGGRGLLVVALGLGLASVFIWNRFGTLTPYAVVQFGGIALIGVLLLLPSRGPGPNWTVLIAAYAFAKAFEGADQAVFAATGHLVSGHTLKHLVAALPVLAVTMALDFRRNSP